MNPVTVVLRLVGLLLVAASFFGARILAVFPGLPLSIKTILFAAGVALYATGAVMDKVAWSRARRAERKDGL